MAHQNKSAQIPLNILLRQQENCVWWQKSLYAWWHRLHQRKANEMLAQIERTMQQRSTTSPEDQTIFVEKCLLLDQNAAWPWRWYYQKVKAKREQRAITLYQLYCWLKDHNLKLVASLADEELAVLWRTPMTRLLIWIYDIMNVCMSENAQKKRMAMAVVEESAIEIDNIQPVIDSLDSYICLQHPKAEALFMAQKIISDLIQNKTLFSVVLIETLEDKINKIDDAVYASVKQDSCNLINQMGESPDEFTTLLHQLHCRVTGGVIQLMQHHLAEGSAPAALGTYSARLLLEVSSVEWVEKHYAALKSWCDPESEIEGCLNQIRNDVEQSLLVGDAAVNQPVFYQAIELCARKPSADIRFSSLQPIVEAIRVLDHERIALQNTVSPALLNVNSEQMHAYTKRLMTWLNQLKATCERLSAYSSQSSVILDMLWQWQKQMTDHLFDLLDAWHVRLSMEQSDLNKQWHSALSQAAPAFEDIFLQHCCVELINAERQQLQPSLPNCYVLEYQTKKVFASHRDVLLSRVAFYATPQSGPEYIDQDSPLFLRLQTLFRYAKLKHLKYGTQLWRNIKMNFISYHLGRRDQAIAWLNDNHWLIGPHEIRNEQLAKEYQHMLKMILYYKKNEGEPGHIKNSTEIDEIAALTQSFNQFKSTGEITTDQYSTVCTRYAETLCVHFIDQLPKRINHLTALIEQNAAIMEAYASLTQVESKLAATEQMLANNAAEFSAGRTLVQKTLKIALHPDKALFKDLATSALQHLDTILFEPLSLNGMQSSDEHTHSEKLRSQLIQIQRDLNYWNAKLEQCQLYVEMQQTYGREAAIRYMREFTLGMTPSILVQMDDKIGCLMVQAEQQKQLNRDFERKLREQKIALHDYQFSSASIMLSAMANLEAAEQVSPRSAHDYKKALVFLLQALLRQDYDDLKDLSSIKTYAQQCAEARRLHADGLIQLDNDFELNTQQLVIYTPPETYFGRFFRQHVLPKPTTPPDHVREFDRGVPERLVL